MPKNRPTLPSNRAFVVQVHADAQIEQGQFKGRVEHLNSREAAHFASLEELLAFMARIVTAQEQAEISSENDG
jgi:hypothetical protein